jgi:hypothetical protein
VKSPWPNRSMSPKLANTRWGSASTTIAFNASKVKASGAWSVTGSSGFGSQR